MSPPTAHANADLPAVDERLVAPESGYEIDDGNLGRVPPKDPPRAIRHSKMLALLEVHVADELEVAASMLTRLSETTDRAADVSVFPRAPDPRTGGRQLEQLAFEIVDTGSLFHAGRKAQQMCARGARRVFAVDVERVRALEWPRDVGTWRDLDSGSAIEDPALAVPLPVDALAGSAEADDAIARALLAKRNPVIMAAIDPSWMEGRLEAIAEAVLRVLAKRGLAVRAEERDRILARA